MFERVEMSGPFFPSLIFHRIHRFRHRDLRVRAEDRWWRRVGFVEVWSLSLKQQDTSVLRSLTNQTRLIDVVLIFNNCFFSFKKITRHTSNARKKCKSFWRISFWIRITPGLIKVYLSRPFRRKRMGKMKEPRKYGEDSTRVKVQRMGRQIQATMAKAKEWYKGQQSGERKGNTNARVRI